MTRHYVGPFVARTALDPLDGTGEFWAPPLGTVAAVDLRRGLSTAGVGYFVVPDTVSLDSDYTLLGQGHIADIVPREALKRTWGSRLDIVGLQGTSLLDLLWNTLTIHSDPEGLTHPAPLMPGSDGRIELLLAQSRAVRRKRLGVSSPEAAPVIELRKREYRRYRTQAQAGELNGDVDFHRRILTYWGRIHGVRNPEDVFIPSDLPPETPLPHNTIVTDDFNRASLGANWTAVEGSGTIVSNQVSPKGDGVSDFVLSAALRFGPTVSTDNHYCEIDFVSTSSPYFFISTTARNDTNGLGANNAYWFYARQQSGSREIGKVINGSNTSLSSDTNGQAPPRTIRIEANGSSIKGFDAGSLAFSITDTSITGNVRGGIGTHLNLTSSRFGDNWECGDIPQKHLVPPSPWRRFQAHLAM